MSEQSIRASLSLRGHTTCGESSELLTEKDPESKLSFVKDTSSNFFSLTSFR